MRDLINEFDIRLLLVPFATPATLYVIIGGWVINNCVHLARARVCVCRCDIECVLIFFTRPRALTDVHVNRARISCVNRESLMLSCSRCSRSFSFYMRVRYSTISYRQHRRCWRQTTHTRTNYTAVRSERNSASRQFVRYDLRQTKSVRLRLSKQSVCARKWRTALIICGDMSRPAICAI